MHECFEYSSYELTKWFLFLAEEKKKKSVLGPDIPINCQKMFSISMNGRRAWLSGSEWLQFTETKRPQKSKKSSNKVSSKAKDFEKAVVIQGMGSSGCKGRCLNLCFLEGLV